MTLSTEYSESTGTGLHEFLRTRCSIRSFRPERVSEPAIERMLLSAAHAPSAHNRQPWRFCTISSLEVKQRLAEAMAADFRRDLASDGASEDRIETQIKRSYQRVISAPLVIILSMDMGGMDNYPDARRAAAERTMAVQSVAAAGTQLLLAAHAEGLGGVWVCSPLFAPKAVRETLKLPMGWEPQAMFFIGYPAAFPPPKERKALKDISMLVLETDLAEKETHPEQTV